MNQYVLDINDRNLSLYHGEKLLLSSPGYCFRQGDVYQFGESARAQGRLHPRSIQHRYWWQLGLDPLQPAFGPARHSADLVHQHLLELYQLGGKPDQLILAVPGSMQTEQLSLLLGIVTQCPFEIAGIVDRAVASAATTTLAAHSYQLELQLHQSLITQLQLVEGQVRRGTVTPVPGCGWLALQDALAKAIADTFIRQTRFDPRRKATSEQKLYDSLGSLLQQLAEHSEINFELDGRQARLERSTLQASCQPVIDRITQAVPAASQQLLLDPVLALLPGATQSFQNAQVMQPAAVNQGIRQHLGLIADSEADVRHITQLPALSALPVAAVTATAATEIVTTATQREVAATAAPVAEAVVETPAAQSSFRLEYADGCFTLHPGTGAVPRVNGQPLRATMQLRSGDTVETADGNRVTITASEPVNGPQTQ